MNVAKLKAIIKSSVAVHYDSKVRIVGEVLTTTSPTFIAWKYNAGPKHSRARGIRHVFGS